MTESKSTNQNFEDVANRLRPTLHSWIRHPQRIVGFEPDDNAYFSLKPKPAKHALSELPVLNWTKNDQFVLDFGIHMVGYVSFKLDFTGSNMDAPCRLHLTVGESPLDVTMDMNNVDTWLSTSWLPDETINIDMCPTTVSLSRRYSFRYLRLRVIDVSSKYTVRFSEVRCDCVSAIGQDTVVDRYEFNNELMDVVDHVGLNTLRDCMQTIFEDGPRRDRRLWIGDLRLQALTNYCSFRDYDLVKRCLYMFAAVARPDGSLPACVFEQPTLSASTDYIVDFDALFAPTVLDYVSASKDLSSGHELWDTVQGCLKRALGHIHSETGLFDPNLSDDWKFLDWQSDLDRSAGEHGLLLYSLKAANQLARLLSKPEPYLNQVSEFTAATSQFLSEDSLFISGPKSQISHASAAWLVLAEGFPREIARKALLNTLSHPDSIKPLTPYLWHHVCDALATVGCYNECIDLVLSYWGAMVSAGADTFWECFDVDNPMASPYGDVRNNSFCHAWSCTPSYLLRVKLGRVVGSRVVEKMTMGEMDEWWIKRACNEG